MSTTVTAGVKSVDIRAVVIRADGTRCDLGVIGTWHRNPIVRLYRRLLSWFRR